METIEMNKGTWEQRSDSIINLAKALCQTQATVEAVKKDANNPFFKSKYADLASIWHAIREALTTNGLSVLQEPSTEGNKVRITTTLIHTSGEYVRSTLEVMAIKTDPQGIGSAITYARRYALGSIVGIAPEEDDGHAASNNNDSSKSLGKQAAPNKSLSSVKPADDLNTEMHTYALRKFFEGKDFEFVKSMTDKFKKAGGKDMGNDVWKIPQLIEKLAPYYQSEKQAA